MKTRIATVWTLFVLIMFWRLLSWWSTAGLGDEFAGTRVLGIMGAIILAIGLMTFSKSRSYLSFVFFLYCSAMAFHWGGYPIFSDSDDSAIIITVYSFFSIFLGSTILHFSILYPKSPIISRQKMAVIYGPVIVGLILILTSVFNRKMLELFIGLEPLVVTIFALIGAILLFRTYFKIPLEQRRSIGADIVCIGIVVANFPYLFSEFIPAMNFGDGLSFLFYRLLFVIQPIAFAIAVRKTEKFTGRLDSTLVGK